MSKFRDRGSLTIGQTTYCWQVIHYGGASSLLDRPRGLAANVWVEPRQTRELVVEFAFTDYFFARPRQQAEFETRLRTAISAALENGWDPLSRGKPFRQAALALPDSRS